MMTDTTIFLKQMKRSKGKQVMMFPKCNTDSPGTQSYFDDCGNQLKPSYEAYPSPTMTFETLRYVTISGTIE